MHTHPERNMGWRGNRPRNDVGVASSWYLQLMAVMMLYPFVDRLKGSSLFLCPRLWRLRFTQDISLLLAMG